MKLIVGLGNPGSFYDRTKHNMGFSVVEHIAKAYDIAIDRDRHHSIVGKGKIEGVSVALALPQTYMNLSGKAVCELCDEELKDLTELLVICDDINLNLGRIRLRHKGSSGGHKGLTSIIAELGGGDFARLRVGIATDLHRGDISDYVLSPFTRNQTRNANHALALAEEAAICWVTEGIDPAMMKFNKRRAGTS